MAVVTRDTRAHYDASTAALAFQISGLIAGEDINAGEAAYIKAADGKIYRSLGAAANEAAKVDGFSPRDAKAGQALTLYGRGTRFRWATGLTPGANLYLGAAVGTLDTAPTTGGLVPIARAIDGTDIRIINDAV
jgi:hypothetical protein